MEMQSSQIFTCGLCGRDYYADGRGHACMGSKYTEFQLPNVDIIEGSMTSQEIDKAYFSGTYFCTLCGTEHYYLNGKFTKCPMFQELLKRVQTLENKKSSTRFDDLDERIGRLENIQENYNIDDRFEDLNEDYNGLNGRLECLEELSNDDFEARLIKLENKVNKSKKCRLDDLEDMVCELWNKSSR